MDILRYKLPLKVMFDIPIIKNGYETHDVLMEELDFNSINPKDIEFLDGQYDWIEAWRNREYDKKMGGFNNKDVKMEVTYDKGNYILTLVSEQSFCTIVRCNRYYSSDPNEYKEMTLKEAVEAFLEGCIWDGIGENEIGYITYQHQKCEVWFEHSGKLIDI